MEQSSPISSQVSQEPKLGAGFGIRAGAQIIDLIIHNVFGLGMGVLIGLFIGVYAGITGTPVITLTSKLQTNAPIGYLLALLGYVLYHMFCEGIHGATLGKLIFKIHVLKEDGSPASMGSAFIRSLAFYVDGILFGLVAAASMRSSALQQRLGDKWAKTIVVERSSLMQFQWPSGWRFVIAFLIALAADGLMVIISIALKLL